MRTLFTLIFCAAITTRGLALTVSINASLQGGYTPEVVGTTNLPDETLLMLELSSRDGSYVAQSKAIVTAGAFRGGPFSDRNRPLSSGAYRLEVTMPLAAVQPPHLWPIIGNQNSKLQGPLVKRSQFGGNVVEYRTTIKIGAATIDGPTAAAMRQQPQALQHTWWLKACNETCIQKRDEAAKGRDKLDFDRCYYACVADEPAKK